MIHMPEPSGAVFALWWRDGQQEAAFIDYGPKELRSAAETIRRAQAAAAQPPRCTAELILSCSIMKSVVTQDLTAAGRSAAALAQHTGWQFIIIQENHQRECFMQHAPVQDRRTFEMQVLESLKLVPGPLGLETSPLPPEELIRGPRNVRKRVAKGGPESGQLPSRFFLPPVRN
jgi:hypothetical protein